MTRPSPSRETCGGKFVTCRSRASCKLAPTILFARSWRRFAETVRPARFCEASLNKFPCPLGGVAVLTRWSCLPLALLTLSSLAVAADPAAVRQKLYVTNSTGDDVTIVDVATNKTLGRIEVGP